MRAVPPAARRWIVPLLVFGLALLAGSFWAFARQEPAGPPPPTPASDGFLARGYAELEAERTATSVSTTSTWDLLGAMLVPTAIVLVAAYATIRVLRSLNQRVAASVSRTRLLELVDSLSLAGSGVVHIVRLGERYLLVGAGSGGLSLLAELRPEEVQLLQAERRQRPSVQAVVPPFRDLVQARLPRSWRVFDLSSADVSAAQAEPSVQVQATPRFGHVPEETPPAPTPGAQ